MLHLCSPVIKATKRWRSTVGLTIRLATQADVTLRNRRPRTTITSREASLVSVVQRIGFGVAFWSAVAP